MQKAGVIDQPDSDFLTDGETFPNSRPQSPRPIPEASSWSEEDASFLTTGSIQTPSLFGPRYRTTAHRIVMVGRFIGSGKRRRSPVRQGLELLGELDPAALFFLKESGQRGAAVGECAVPHGRMSGHLRFKRLLFLPVGGLLFF